MKAINALVILAALAGTAHADEVDDLLFDLGRSIANQQTNRLDSATCTGILARLRATNTPATRTITVSEGTRYLPAGTHALPAVRKACDALEYQGKVDEAKRVIRLAIEMGASRGCADYWPKIVAAGVKPSEPMDEELTADNGRSKPIRITGTIGELKTKYCDGVVAERAAEQAAAETPFRKVLKNDKLAVFLDYRREHGIVLRGGDTSEVPAKIAKANVWFTWRLGQDCTDGRTKYVVRRYEFDAAQRLTKESVKEHCGEAVFK